MKRLNIVWIEGVVLAAILAVGCGSANPATTAGPSSLGDGSSRVGTLGAPPPSTIGPGAGTGAGAPTVGGAGISCPTDQPIISVNANNGKIDLSTTKVLGLTRSYEWEIERDSDNVFRFAARLFSDAKDGREGLYAQPVGLMGGIYRVRVRALRVGCGATDRGSWSVWTPFSV